MPSYSVIDFDLNGWAPAPPASVNPWIAVKLVKRSYRGMLCILAFLLLAQSL